MPTRIQHIYIYMVDKCKLIYIYHYNYYWTKKVVDSHLSQDLFLDKKVSRPTFITRVMNEKKTTKVGPQLSHE